MVYLLKLMMDTPELLVFDGFITEATCDSLISLHKASDTHRTHRNTVILDLEEHLLLPRLAETAQKYWGDSVVRNYSEVVFWPTGEFQGMHLDFDYHVLTSILYLNDAFTGGRTMFNDGSFIAPKKGRIVFFTGDKLVHGVEPVFSGERWTCPTWYKLKG